MLLTTNLRSKIGLLKYRSAEQSLTSMNLTVRIAKRKVTIFNFLKYTKQLHNVVMLEEETKPKTLCRKMVK